MIEFLKKVNKYCLYLLVFSATFEYWDPFHIAQSFSITRMTTIVYFLSSIPFFRGHLNFQNLKRYIWPLLFFILAGIVSSALNDIYVQDFSDVVNTRLLQLVILMILIAGHVSADKTVLKGALGTYVLSLFMMSTLNLLFGVGEIFSAGRLYIFGENPNLTGMKATVAILIIVANLIDKGFSVKRFVLSIILVLPILNLLVLTGSRGGLLSLFAGVLIMMLLIKVGFIKKMMLLFIGFCLSAYLFSYILLNDQEFGKRIESSISKGETGGRTHLWVSAYQIIEDNALFGVSTAGLMPMMRKYSGKYTQPHNVFLYVWLTSGVVGFFFFMVFIFRLIKSLYKEFKHTRNVLNLIIFVVILLNMSKSGGSIGFIFAWIFWALLIASILINENNRPKQERLNEDISSIQ